MYLEKKTVVGQKLTLDGATLIKSKFRNCTFVFSGLLPSYMDTCEFDDCKWEFAGPAKEVLGFFAATHAMGGDAAQLVENTFNSITKKGPPPSGPTLPGPVLP